MNIYAQRIQLGYDFALYDHFSLFVDINIDFGEICVSPEYFAHEVIDWNTFNSEVFCSRVDN